MKCEACGGDGQIEYGAYRGDEAGPTRECRLCGGVIAQVVPLETLGVSAQSASAGLNRLSHVVSESGKRLIDLVITTGKSPKEVYRDKQRPARANTNRIKRIHEQRKAASQTAREIAAERLEQLRQENEREQLKAESHGATPTSAIMNDLIRRL